MSNRELFVPGQDPRKVGERTPLGPVVRVDTNPLVGATPKGPRLLYVEEIGGPETGADQRIYLPASLLAHWLDVARSSATNQLVLHQVGVRVEILEGADGHVFSVWKLRSLPPSPER